jgi:hypothetical protein
MAGANAAYSLFEQNSSFKSELLSGNKTAVKASSHQKNAAAGCARRDDVSARLACAAALA